ncbi:MAG TPA: SUMF1/EgtB/PvdO family nonheme iron enzyme, partial [Blastocatellia bacterium]|nr:SUMF1/EgtB/PvdO family nonheme iron enzyme [Blastocatellia bacterium]
MVTNEHNLAFGEFIEHLRRHGFTIGVDHYLRLQHLLDRVGGDCAPADLKTILCPIFATNNVQQEQFYHAFDSYFPLFQPSITQEQAGVESAQEQVGLIAEETKPVVPRKRFKVIATAVAATFVIALATATALYFFKKPQTETAIPPAEQIETEVPANVVAVETVVQPTPPGEELSFWERYGNGIRLAAVFLPLIIFAVYEWRRYRQRKLVLQQQRRKKPPYTWPLRVESSPARLYDSAEFYTAARLMRQRQVDEFYRLDVDATVAATIESLGYPTFRYKPYSKPPEYLALIDRASFRDHQARLFGELSAALEQEGVYVARYFYEGDPRVCSEPGGSYVQLAELQRRHAGHRLLIFGNGEKLIDPITGKLAAWTHLFMDWQGRALLTPEVPARWGHREINLAAEFVVLPATLAGLLAIVDHFEAPEAADLRSWLPDSDAPPPRDADFPALAASLRRYFGEEAFQWLCACAVYPELHWDLTLYLGQLECMGEGLIGEENLLRMIRLPWFRSGAMPDELRWLLIGQLNREKEKAIRRAIIELLEHSPPPQGSFADDAYQLNLALQRWLHSRDRERRREILRVVRTLPRSQAARDHTLVRFLESTRSSPLAILLPERLRKLFYQNGLSIFGLKTGVHLCAALLASAIALIVYLTNYSPAPSLPAGIDSPSVETVIVEPPPRMVFVKGGTFMMGTDDPDADPISKPAHLVTVSDFFLDINEVTNEEYYLFIKATGYKPPPHWKNGIYVPGEGRFPVVN